MCGITGILCLDGKIHYEEFVSTIELMSKEIKKDQ